MKRRLREFLLFCFIVFKKAVDNELFYMANALTYRMIMAFFPFLIFILSLFQFINYDTSVILMNLVGRLPEGFAVIVKNFIDNAYLSNTVMSVSLLYGIWSATMGFHSIIKGMNRCSAVKEQRNFIVVWLSSFVLVFIFTAYILLCLVFVVFDELLVKLLQDLLILKPLAYALQNLPLGILSSLLTIALVLIFYEFTAARRHSFKELLPGAVFTIAAWLVLSEAFSLYIKINKGAFHIYGSIAGIFITIFWVNLLAMTLLLGAQVNAVILKYDKFRRENINLYKFYLSKFKWFLRGKFYEKTKS